MAPPGIFIILTPISTSGGVAVGRVETVEVLEHLLTAVVGLDASAVQRERTVQSVAPPERDAAASEVVGLLRRWFSLDVVASVVIAGRASAGFCWCRGYACCAGVSTPMPTTSSLTGRTRRKRWVRLRSAEDR